MKGMHVAVAALVGINLVTALGIVHTKHQSRMHFKELRAVQQSIDDANTEWGRLQIEESSLARFGRIEEIASGKLNMRMPEHSEIKMVFE